MPRQSTDLTYPPDGDDIDALLHDNIDHPDADDGFAPAPAPPAFPAGAVNFEKFCDAVGQELDELAADLLVPSEDG